MEISLAPDGRVLLFTVAIALAAALAFSFAPLFTDVRTPIVLALKSSAATAFQGNRLPATHERLLLFNLERESLGLRTSGLLVFGLNPQLKAQSDSQASRFFDGLLEKLHALPGVESVTLMENRIGSG